MLSYRGVALAAFFFLPFSDIYSHNTADCAENERQNERQHKMQTEIRTGVDKLADYRQKRTADDRANSAVQISARLCVFRRKHTAHKRAYCVHNPDGGFWEILVKRRICNNQREDKQQNKRQKIRKSHREKYGFKARASVSFRGRKFNFFQKNHPE